MKIHGTVFEITDLNGFVEEVLGLLSKSALSSLPSKRSHVSVGGLVGTAAGTLDETLGALGGLLPDGLGDLIDSLTSAGIVRPLARARVQLGLLLPGLLPGAHAGGSFFPPLSVKATTDAAGAYTLTVSDERGARAPAPRGFVLVYKPSGSVSLGGQTLQLFSLLYRSESFELGEGDRAAAPIFIRREAGRPEQAVTQAEINQRVEAIRRKRKLEEIDARIGNDEIAVRVADRGGKLTFDIALRGSSSPNLNELLDLKVRNFALDLPGPDFITTLCLDEAQVERDVRADVASLERSVNNEIRTQVVNSVSQATGLPSEAVETFFRDFATVSIPAVNTARQSFKVGSDVGLIRSIVLDVSLGVPRRLFAEDESKRK